MALGTYDSGKPGKLWEFVHSGKLRKNSGNLDITSGISIKKPTFVKSVKLNFSCFFIKYLVLQYLFAIEFSSMNQYNSIIQYKFKLGSVLICICCMGHSNRVI